MVKVRCADPDQVIPRELKKAVEDRGKRLRHRGVDEAVIKTPSASSYATVDYRNTNSKSSRVTTHHVHARSSNKRSEKSSSKPYEEPVTVRSSKDKTNQIHPQSYNNSKASKDRMSRYQRDESDTSSTVSQYRGERSKVLKDSSTLPHYNLSDMARRNSIILEEDEEGEESWSEEVEDWEIEGSEESWSEDSESEESQSWTSVRLRGSDYCTCDECRT